MSPLPGVRAAIRKLIVRTASRMPDGILLDMINRLSMQRKLDYAGHDLFLNVASPDEYFIRVFSCQKEPETVRWIESSARQGDVFYDIGANVGAYTLIASKAAGAGVKVYAFEPAFANFAQLCANIQLNDSGRNTVPLPIALSDANGFASLMLTNKSGKSARFDSAMNGTEAKPASYPQTVPTWRLDDLVRSLAMEAPTLMKIDVDGAEPEVLGGATATLRNRALRSIQIELETDEDTAKSVTVLAMLSAAGFTREAKYAHTRYANYLFVR